MENGEGTFTNQEGTKTTNENNDIPFIKDNISGSLRINGYRAVEDFPAGETTEISGSDEAAVKHGPSHYAVGPKGSLDESAPAVLRADNVTSIGHSDPTSVRNSRLWSSLPRMPKETSPSPAGYIQVLGYKYLSSGGDNTPHLGSDMSSVVPLRDELPSPLVKPTTEAFFFMPPKPEERDNTRNSSPHLERERIKRQNLTDGASLLLLIPGLFLSILSPFLLIPAYGFYNPYVDIFRYLFFVLTVVSVGLNIAGGLVGNVMWYFDESENRWRYKLHCGRGPRDHYWGADLMKKKDKSLPDGIV